MVKPIKVCKNCKEYKPINEFYRFWTTGRIHTHCKACVNAKNKAWGDAHPDVIRRTKEKWNKANPQSGRDKSRRWRKRHPDKRRAADNRRRARKYKNGGSYTAAQFKELCERYGNRCLRCGQVGGMTADHVIPLSKGGSNDISNIQPLCSRCNNLKRTDTTDYR